MRIIYLALGIIFLGIGVIGVWLPGLPGTFPLILSAGFFAKSNPKFERWMLEHPKFGPTIVAWRETGSISRKHKTIAISMMWANILIVCYFAPWWSALLAAAAAVGVTIYLVTRPTRLEIPAT